MISLRTSLALLLGFVAASASSSSARWSGSVQPFEGICDYQLASESRVLWTTHDKGWLNDDDRNSGRVAVDAMVVQ